MQKLTIRPINHGLKGEISVPGDKSISHRAIMFGSIAQGKTVITNFLNAEDCLRTAKTFQAMGIEIEGLGTDKVIVNGKGLDGLQEPKQVLDLGNSGTSIRLMTGLLAGQKFFSVLTGDKSICLRPMNRVIAPLSQMGASIIGRDNNKFPPLAVQGSKLKGIHYNSPIASAQVKSCVLLAGLYASGTTAVTEPTLSRDHTERMLKYFGGSLEQKGLTVKLKSGQRLRGRKVAVPGDISSAAFFLVASMIVPDSEMIIKNVGINPTRTGILDALQFMGAKLKFLNKKERNWEPISDIQVKHTPLRAMEFSKNMIPRIIDEIPILAVLATQIKGNTVIRDAAELRVKETDRIKAIVTELNKMGASVDELKDGLVVYGPTHLVGTKVQSYGDHRMAMALAIAGLIAEGETVIEDTECIDTSFPTFTKLLDELT